MKIRMQLATSTAMALGLAFLAVPAMAQDAEPAQYLGRVILGYSADGTPVYAGENTSAIEGGSVSAQGGTARLDDIVRQMPGVMTRLDQGQPGVAVAIRGLQGQGRVAMTVEGVPQNFRFNGHTSEGYTYVEQSFLSGIDVTRGAKLTAGGSGLAGSANFSLLRAEDFVDPEKGWGGISRLTYGTNQADFSRMLGLGMVQGQLSVMGALAYRDADNYEDGKNAEVANSDRNTDAYMLRGEYRIDDSQTLEFLATRNTAEFAANSYYQELTSDLFKLGYHYSDGSLVNLSVNAYTASTESEYVGSLTGTGLYVGRIMETTTTGIDVTNVSTLSFGDWELNSTNGFEYIYDKLGGEAGGANPTFGNSKRLGVFTENVFANGPLEVTAGLRYNSYKLHGQVDTAILSGPVDIDEDSVDPKLTIAYQANDWLQPYASIYRTSRAPSLQETLQDSLHNYGIDVYLGPNPNLRTEIGDTREIGFNIDKSNVLSTGDQLTARVAYFDMDIENYIAYAQETQRLPGGGMRITSYFANIPGTTESKGLELEALYEADRFAVALSYTNSKSTPPAGSEGYQLQPDDTFSATVMGKFFGGRLGLGTTYSHVSSGTSIDRLNDAGTIASKRIDSYGLWDVFARYEVNQDFFLTAKVSNVEDVTYTPWAASSNAPGRSAFIGGEIRF